MRTVRAFLIVALFGASITGCGPWKRLHFVEAVEIPLQAENRTELAELLNSSAKHEQLFFQDASDHTNEITKGVEAAFMVVYRPLGGDHEWPEIQVMAGKGERIWVMFLEAADDEHKAVTDQTRTRILAELKSRWPDLRAIPILPSGGVPPTPRCDANTRWL